MHQQYNVFLLRLEGKKNDAIANFIKKNYEKYSGRVSAYKLEKDSNQILISHDSLRRVYRASEQLVVDVSNGLF